MRPSGGYLVLVVRLNEEDILLRHLPPVSAPRSELASGFPHRTRTPPVRSRRPQDPQAVSFRFTDSCARSPPAQRLPHSGVHLGDPPLLIIGGDEGEAVSRLPQRMWRPPTAARRCKAQTVTLSTDDQPLRDPFTGASMLCRSSRATPVAVLSCSPSISRLIGRDEIKRRLRLRPPERLLRPASQGTALTLERTWATVSA